MTDLQRMQEYLDNNAELRSAFLDDPATVMKELGFEISSQDEAALCKSLSEQLKGPLSKNRRCAVNRSGNSGLFNTSE